MNTNDYHLPVGGLEEGSLLHTAISTMQKKRQLEARSLDNVRCGPSTNNNTSSTSTSSSNTLTITLHPLHDPPPSPPSPSPPISSSSSSPIPHLAKILSLVNTHLLQLQSRTPHPWHAGGDGLVFGLSPSSPPPSHRRRPPHLRAKLYYGESPIDEWHAIKLCHDVSHHLLKNHDVSTAIQCIDDDDGQILLIEAAMVLPSWCDEVTSCENRVWIVDGGLRLIGPGDDDGDDVVGREEALAILRRGGGEMMPRVQEVIERRMNRDGGGGGGGGDVVEGERQRRRTTSPHGHVAAVALPLALASVLKKRPDLVNIAVLSFRRHADTTPTTTTTASATATRRFSYRHLVVLPCHFSKVSYATLLSTEWNPSFPKDYAGIETTRMRRRCRVDACPYFKSAVDLGMKLTWGCEWLCRGGDDATGVSKDDALDKRRASWHQWEESYSSSSSSSSSSSLVVDAAHCPSFDEVCRDICPLSHPRQSIRSQIETIVFRTRKKTVGDFPMPRSVDVDGDEWLYSDSVEAFDDRMRLMVDDRRQTGGGDGEGVAGGRNGDAAAASASSSTKAKEERRMDAIDEVLDGFKRFVEADSDVQGVQTTRNDKEGCYDDYFSDEDDDSSTSDESDGGEERGGDYDRALRDVMRAMDQELNGTNVERHPMESSRGEKNDDDDDDPVDFDVSVLSNLLSSLEAEDGGIGPASNMLREMGISVPKMDFVTGDDNDDGRRGTTAS